ncbi:energy transducer TonB [Sphingomonas morindae]|uniref:TonB family protein n=1 Tax=Sphingomonas morindae TaxID=1541170 RepID=A0ABY4X5M8_9SPHN|nr:TonB family protein [Sphingomonas morindae]USI72202.1 TonB family protein [Sphingomonas morindae]
MHRFSPALVGATLALALGTPVAAHQTRKPAPSINVMAETPAQWQARINESLDRNLVYPTMLSTAPAPDGVVRIAFRCSETGQPQAVRLIESGGSHALDRAALKAVASIETLHPLPAGIDHDRAMEAWIVFASDEAGVARQRRLLTERTERLARRLRESDPRYAETAPLIIAAVH